jgi:hypothetical protein
MVMNGTRLSEKEIAPKLMINGHPDLLFAVARLVLFDNVQAFVDSLKEWDEQPPHPADGIPYGKFYGPKQRTVQHRGMWLSKDIAQYVHEISYSLNEPRWWEEFQRLASEQGVKYNPYKDYL